MASEDYKCNAEPSITDIEEDGTEQIPTYFVDIHDILKREIKEEATEFKPSSEYRLPNDCLESNENGKFDDTNSREFEVMLRDVEDTKFSHFNSFGGELSVSHHFNNGVMLKNEDHSECIDDSLKNNSECKAGAMKNEDDIDVIYNDVKPEICQRKSSENGPYPNVTDIFIETEIGPNFSHKLSKDSETWSHHNIEEDGTAAERDNDPFESKQEFNARPDSEEKPCQCKICLKYFASKFNFLYHEKTHTSEKPFYCKVCSKSFKRKEVGKHMKVHIGKKPFQCKFCPKAFYEKGDLTRHERVHTGEKPFQCKICLKSFNQKMHLMVHEKTHTDEKPFQCKICSIWFKRKGDLTKHEITHTGEKPFQCNICLKLFKRKGYLVIHERIHTGEKPFQCKICSKLFTQKAHLTAHEGTHIGEKPF